MENETAVTTLSPAAQAVLDAYIDAPCGTPSSAWVGAALRAAADQVDDLDVPLNYEGDSFWIYEKGQDAAAGCLRAIAAELEGAN